MLNWAKKQGNIQGATVSKERTRINHLLFTNNCIFYSKATKSNWEVIQDILNKYEK